MDNGRIIIIGGSAAGISAAKEIRNIDQKIDITIITEENYYPYYRPYLTEYISNRDIEKKSNFYLNSENWFIEKNIELKRGEKVTEINLNEKTVITSKKENYKFDKLIIATGSNPFVPFKDATNKKNVFIVRTYDDAKEVNEYCSNITKAIIIGGGLLGLEAAHSLVKKGIHVSVIELKSRILPLQLDDEGSAIIEGILRENKINLVLGKGIESIVGNDTASGIKLASGEEIQGDMIIFSIGVRANCELAKNCGIQVNRAIVVNEKMETSVPGIYACGDVAEFNGKTIALWMPAVKQGKVAGSNAAGTNLEFINEDYPAVLNSFGTHVYSLGNICINQNEQGIRIYKNVDNERKIYKKLYFKNDKLVGVILIGDISQAQKLSMGIKNGLSYDMIVKD